MSSENLNHQPSADHSVLGTSSKHKRLILYDKTFLINIVDKKVNSKIEKLICLYGGKIIQSLENNTDYLISDISSDERVKHKNGSELSNCKRDIEVQNVSSSKCTNSVDLINKANLFNIKILSAKQFQRLLKFSLKKHRVNKKPTDKVASVLRGKVSLKIESMDQGQCPVFEFIPKWPDLGDTLSKSKPIIQTQNSFNGDISGDEYSSDQYSTSEIGGMCELCDMPFMNYKEHINTKKHMRESQDENRFHELDELINERPLNVIFNHFEPEKKISKDENVIMEQSNVKNCVENTVITIVDSDSDNNKQNNVTCSFGDKNSYNLNEQSLKRKYRSTTITFLPQKRPSKLPKSSHKKTKRKHKTHQKILPKDIYKVEVVNNKPSTTKNNSNNNINVSNNKPPVIIRLKRVSHSKRKNPSSDNDSHISISSDDQEIPEKSIPVQRCIRVVRKPSFSNETESKSFSDNQIFTFEHPELRRKLSNEISYYPTQTYISNSRPIIEQIHEKIASINNPRFKCSLSINDSLKIISNMNHEKIGKWFYNIPKKIEDCSSLNSTIHIPSIRLSKIT